MSRIKRGDACDYTFELLNMRYKLHTLWVFQRTKTLSIYWLWLFCVPFFMIDWRFLKSWRVENYTTESMPLVKLWLFCNGRNISNSLLFLSFCMFFFCLHSLEMDLSLIFVCIRNDFLIDLFRIFPERQRKIWLIVLQMQTFSLLALLRKKTQCIRRKLLIAFGLAVFQFVVLQKSGEIFAYHTVQCTAAFAY